MACPAAAQLCSLLAHREPFNLFDFCLLRMRHSFPVLRQDIHGDKRCESAVSGCSCSAAHKITEALHV